MDPHFTAATYDPPILDPHFVQQSLAFFLGALDADRLDMKRCRDLMDMMEIRGNDIREQIFALEMQEDDENAL